MDNNSTEIFKIPPVTEKKDGSPRKVGFELEFSGLTLDKTVDVLKTSLNGESADGTKAEQVVKVESLGDFNVELDWDFFKRMAEESKDDKETQYWLDQLGKAASLLVPVEVVCPPVSVHNINVLDSMVSDLRKAGAKGTEESLTAAYGVHINTEIPDFNEKTVFNYLRSFAILQWWLNEAHNVNLTRKISPYIDLYPEDYLKKLFSYGKAPDLKIICEDYLEFNATRNRALDMLPIFSENYGDRVRNAVDDPKIVSRPAFHYRMPNCSIEKENWSLSHSWNLWCVVEVLSGRSDDLNKLCKKFLDSDLPVFGVNHSKWVEFVDNWLKDNEII